MKNKTVYDLTVSAMLFALGLVLPFLTGQIPEIGNLLLPIHIPVLLAGFIVGWKYGLVIGATLPIVRSLIFSKPAFYPNAIAMAFELAAYGVLTGIFYLVIFKKRTVAEVYASLVIAMLGGRAVKGVVSMFIYGTEGSPYTLSMFIGGAFLEAIPGIILQLVLIPTLLLAIKRAKIK
jgi:thiamine transporter ThiT